MQQDSDLYTGAFRMSGTETRAFVIFPATAFTLAPAHRATIHASIVSRGSCSCIEHCGTQAGWRGTGVDSEHAYVSSLSERGRGMIVAARLAQLLMYVMIL